MGTLTLRRFNGIEQYQLMESHAHVIRKDDGTIMMWFEVETTPHALMTVADTAEHGMNPNAEVTLYLDKLVLREFGTRSFELSQGYNEENRALDAMLYYFEHQEVNDNHIRVEYKGNGRFDLRWTGTTMDISYYDGSKPNTLLEIEGQFMLDDYSQWEMEG